MSEEEKVVEVDVDVIDVDSIKKVSIEDGDALIISLPEQADRMPEDVRVRYIQSIQQTFEEIFKDKQLRVIIIPHGMEVQLLATSLLEDKDDA